MALKKTTLYLVLRILFVLAGMEATSYTIFMFSHFVEDLNASTAQRDFSIAFSLLWFSAFMFNPILGIIMDKTGQTYRALAVLCCIKAVCLLTYTFSKNIYVINTALVCSVIGSQSLVIHTEIKHLFEPKERVAKMSETVGGYIIGDTIMCLLRFVPRGFEVKVGSVEVTNNTLPMLINAILFCIFAWILIFIACEHKKRLVSDNKSSMKSIGKKEKLFVIFLTSFLSRFTSISMVIAVQEFAEKNNMANLFLGIVFTLRYGIAYAANILQKRFLNQYSNKLILASWQIIRMICFGFSFISTFSSNRLVQVVILLTMMYLSSISWLYDDAVLLPELWKTTDQIYLYSAVYELFGVLGTSAAFLYPLFSNITEMYFSVGMFVLSLNFLMLRKTELI